MRSTVLDSRGIRWDGLIAIWEIFAGLAGLALTLAGWTRLRLADLPGLGEFGLACLLYSLLFCAGILLWREEKRGYMLSLILLALQSAAVVWGAAAYRFAAGPKAGMVLEWPGPSILPLIALDCRLLLSFSAAAPAGRLELDLLAVMALILLAFAFRRHSRLSAIERENQTSVDMNAMYSSRFTQWP